MSDLIKRLEANARQIEKSYERANDILNDAVKEAMPWAGQLAMQGRVPTLDRIERLATQLVAILLASEPSQKTVAQAVHEARW